VSLQPGDHVRFVDLQGNPVEHNGGELDLPWFVDGPVTVRINDGWTTTEPVTYWAKDDGIDPETGGRRYKMLPMDRA
jgi:hypothetical protein